MMVRSMIGSTIVLMLTAGGMLLPGCSPPNTGQILLPVRFCVLRGSSLTALQDGSFSDVGNDNIDVTVSQALKDLNTKVWIPGANISFYAALYESLQGPSFNVPVIADPQPPPPSANAQILTRPVRGCWETLM